VADATVTQGRREDALPLAKEPASIAAPRVAAVVSRPLALLWFGIVIAIGAFLAVGTVRIGAGNWAGMRMSVRRIWVHFSRFLTEQGASAVMVGAVTLAAAAALLGAAALLWLALSLKDHPSDPPVEDPAGK